MRKCALILVCCLMATLTAGSVLAGQKSDIHTLMIFQSNWDRNQQDVQIDSQEAIICWDGQQVMGGLEIFRNQEYLRVRPLVGWRAGSWSFYLGGSFDSDNNQFVFPGLRYASAWGGVSVFFDGRQYTGVSTDQEDFTDLYLKLTLPLPGDFFMGVDLAVDHYWGTGNDWALVGPFVGYNISERVAVFARLSRDWSFDGEGSAHNDRIRVGIMFNF